MRVKIFQEGGHDEIRGLENKINEWLSSGVEVKHVDTSMCQIAMDPNAGERYQYLVVTVWYEGE